jgi:hypothetical protein
MSNSTDSTDSSVLPSEVLFIDDLVRILRTSRSTIERRRRSGSFPIPQLASIDGRPRWSRLAIERYLASTSEGRTARRSPRLRRSR